LGIICYPLLCYLPQSEVIGVSYAEDYFSK